MYKAVKFMKIKIWPWSKFDEFEKRIKDLERHFATKYDPKTGAVVETLADIPVHERKEKLKIPSTKGLTWQQRQRILEQTDGFRRPLE